MPSLQSFVTLASLALLVASLGAGPRCVEASFDSTWQRCVPGCVCQLRDVEETRLLPMIVSERRNAHLNVSCTRGHNITLNKFFAKLETLNLDLSVFREVTLKNLLVPTLRLSAFARFPFLSFLNLPQNRISKIVLHQLEKKRTKISGTDGVNSLLKDDVNDLLSSKPRFNVVRHGRYLPVNDQLGDGKGVVNYDDNDNQTEDLEGDKNNEIDVFLSRLVYLDLRSNSVSRLDKTILRKMKGLKVLDLSSNNLHFVAEDAFEESAELIKLFLQDNFITTVPKSTFRSLSKAQILDLSRNQIFSIHPDAFSGCHQLRHLFLSANLLSHISRHLLASLPPFTRISVQNNPFECGCGIEWLLQLLDDRRNAFEFPDSIRCANPPFLADRPLTSLKFSANYSSSSSSSSSSELPCSRPMIHITGLSGLLGGSLPGSVYESLFGPQRPPPSRGPKSVVVFVRADAELDCVADPSVWPRPSILWELPSGVQMAAIPHAHHIPQHLVDAANITDFKTILMKPLDSEHSVTVIPPGILRLTDFRFPMAGNYTCHAISPGGNVTASIRVDIQSAVWNVYISSLFISFATAAISIILASAVGLVVLLVTHFENKKLQSVGLDGTPPIYPTPEESPQLTHKLLTIPVNAAMFENIKDGYDSFRSKIKTGLDKRMEKGRLLVELAWVSGETAISGLKEGTSTGIHKIDHVVRESGVALTRGIRSGGAAVNKSIRESGAVVSQAVYESVSAVKDNVLSLKELCGGVPSTASVCGETPAIDFGDGLGIPAVAGVVAADEDDDDDGVVNHGAYEEDAVIQVHRRLNIAEGDVAVDLYNDVGPTNAAVAHRSSKVDANGRGKLKNDGKRKNSANKKLEAIAEHADGKGGGGAVVGRSDGAAEDAGADVGLGGET